MTDEQIEKLAEKYRPNMRDDDLMIWSDCKKAFKVGARAVRDEMQAELEHMKEQHNIGHIHVHILNEQITGLQQRLELAKSVLDEMFSTDYITMGSRLNESLDLLKECRDDIKHLFDTQFMQAYPNPEKVLAKLLDKLEERLK